jgi:Na+/phosphate symporter
MLVAFIPLVLCLVGLVVYLITVNPRAQEIGRILFFCGLLVTMMALATKTLHIG